MCKAIAAGREGGGGGGLVQVPQILFEIDKTGGGGGPQAVQALSHGTPPPPPTRENGQIQKKIETGGRLEIGWW